METKRWTLTQIASLAFVCSIFAFGLFGGLANASDTLISGEGETQSAH